MPTLKRIIILNIIAILVAGCGLPGMAATTPAPALAISQKVYALALPGASATPTPFLPLPPTSTYIPTDFPTSTPLPPTPTAAPTAVPTQGIAKPVEKSWADYPGPTIWPDLTIPAPTGLLAHPKGQINILLLGSDQRPADPSFRTDTILLLTIDPPKGTVNITSFPRDLYVYIPGWTMQRINTAMGFGGFDELALTFEYNFGVHPDHYVLVNFSSFKQIIDDMGGIKVDVAVSLTDQRDEYGDFTMPAGRWHMNGETALWYVRSRHSTNDFDRGRRQQEVIMGIFNSLLNMDAFSNARQLFHDYQKSITTDMTLDDITPLLPLATTLKRNNVHHYYISPAVVYDWITSQGAMVLVPIREAVLEVMRKALNTPG
jgi:LCP family protein required for cell wall assembly